MINNKFFRPKLENGVKATKWSPCSVYTSSLIKQTSDSILLEVEKQVGGNYATKSDLEITASAITATVSELEQTVSANTQNIGELQVTANNISASVEQLKQTVSGNTQNIGNLQVTANNITASVSELKQTVSANTQNIGKLEVTASAISASVDTYLENNPNPNLFTTNGWKNKKGEFVDPTENLMYEYSGGTITSPKIYLDAGTYCASQYNTTSKQFAINPSVQVTSSATTETYEGATRNYITFHIETAGEYRFIYGTDNLKSTFYRPKLEIGDRPTAYEPQSIHYSSLIQQTSQQISLKVKEEVDNIGEDGTINKFKETGIDITNGLIEINADNTVINGNLKLNAKNDSDALSLYDNDGYERTTVTSQEIGRLIEQSQNSIQKYDKYFLVNYGESTIFTMGEKYFAAKTFVKCGDLMTNRVCYCSCSYKDEKGNWQPQIIPAPKQCEIELIFVNKEDEGITYVAEQKQTQFEEGAYYLESTKINQAIRIETAGTYYVKVRITWPYLLTTSPFDTQTRFYVTTFLSSVSPSKAIIGGDGIYMTNGANDFIYYGKDGFGAAHQSYGYNTDKTSKTAYNMYSSVGAMSSDSVQGNYDDEYIVGEGPSHIAYFKVNGSWHSLWCNSQSYANVTTIMLSDGTYIEEALPSTDVMMLSRFNDNEKYFGIGKGEFNGHIITILNPTGKSTIVRAGNGTRFVDTNGNMSRSNEYTFSSRSIKMIFVYTMGSAPNDGSWNGLWYIM